MNINNQQNSYSKSNFLKKRKILTFKLNILQFQARIHCFDGTVGLGISNFIRVKVKTNISVSCDLSGR